MVVSYRHLLPRWWPDRERATAVDVERVIDGKFFRQLLVVTDAHLLEAPRNGIEPAGFGGQILVRRVGAPHDARHAIQGRVGPEQSILVHQRIEATQRPLMTEFDVRDIVGDRLLGGRFGQDLISRYIEELRLGIDKTADEPGTGNAIDSGPFTGNPFHRTLLLSLSDFLPAAFPKPRFSPVTSRAARCATSPLSTVQLEM